MSGDDDKARRRLAELAAQVAHSDDERLEREIALGDRRAALDGLVQSVSWLIGTALLLNGGALLAVIGKADLPLNVALLSPFVFMFGLFSAIMAAGLTGHFASRSVDTANARLKRLSETELLWAVKWKLRLTYFITFFMVASYMLFGFGALNALMSTADARLKQSAADTQISAPAPHK